MGAGRHVTPAGRSVFALLVIALVALVLLGGAGTARAVNAAYRGVDFITASTGWVVGRDATIMRTRDGGRTWTRQYRERGGPILVDVSMRSDGLHGVAVGSGAAVYRTVDGRHWYRVSSMALDPGLNLTSVRFVTRSVCWACGGHVVSSLVLDPQWGAVYLSADGGATWSLKYSTPGFAPVALDAGGADSVVCFGALRTEGATIINQPAIVTSFDRDTWWPVQVLDDMATNTYPGDYDEAGGRAVAVGGDGFTVPSFAYSRGRTAVVWTPGVLPSSAAVVSLGGVKMVTASVGYAVGFSRSLVAADSRVLKTTDGGRTWRAKARLRGTELLAVDFTSTALGYAVGLSQAGAPLVVKTTDGGRHWTRVR